MGRFRDKNNVGFGPRGWALALLSLSILGCDQDVSSNSPVSNGGQVVAGISQFDQRTIQVALHNKTKDSISFSLEGIGASVPLAQGLVRVWGGKTEYTYVEQINEFSNVSMLELPAGSTLLFGIDICRYFSPPLGVKLRVEYFTALKYHNSFLEPRASLADAQFDCSQRPAQPFVDQSSSD